MINTDFIQKQLISLITSSVNKQDIPEVDVSVTLSIPVQVLRILNHIAENKDISTDKVISNVLKKNLMDSIGNIVPYLNPDRNKAENEFSEILQSKLGPLKEMLGKLSTVQESISKIEEDINESTDESSTSSD